MSTPFAGFLQALERSGVEIDPENARDALWLALRRAERGEGEGSPFDPSLARPTLMDPTSGLETTAKSAASDPATEPGSTDKIADPPTATSPGDAFGPGGGFGSGGGGSLRRIGLPEAAALPGARLLARALRPLRKEVAAPTGLVFDQRATVRRIAEERVWLPVFRPATERWLEVAVVVDASVSMAFWKRAIHELEKTLRYCGAFRWVSTWWLDVQGSGPKLYARHRDLLSRRRQRPINEVTGPGSRRLLLVLSDCVSAAWNDGSIAGQLLSWSQTTLFVLVLILPFRLC